MSAGCAGSSWVRSLRPAEPGAWPQAFLQLSNGPFVQTQSATHHYVSLSYRFTFNH